MKKTSPIISLLILSMIIFGLSFAQPSLAAGPCAASNIRWANTSNRVYVSGDVECTLTEIKTLGSKFIPLTLVDETEKIWFLGANLFLEGGAKVTMNGAAYGGDVNELRLKSNNSSVANSFVELRAEAGTFSFNGVKVTSWDEAVLGPDTEYSTYKRAFIRVRSKLVDGVPQESRMDIKNSDIGYLGYNSSESYGLSWKVLGSTSLFDTVGVYGDVDNSNIHHNYFGAYTYGAQAMTFTNNEVHQNIKYGLDPHDDSDYILIDNNNVHHNGNHGIICSQRCNNITITNNTSSDNIGNGIMLHRNVVDSLVQNNTVSNNSDAGIAVFDSHNNQILNNTSQFNTNGFRASVGTSGNLIENNVFSNNTKYGLYFYKGSDAPTTGDGRPKFNTFKNNQVNANASVAIKLNESDSNTFETNTVDGNSSYAVEINNAHTNLFNNNTTTGNVLNYYYAKTNGVNTIKDSDAFSVKIGDTLSSISIVDADRTIFSNTKNLATNVDVDQALIGLNKTNASSSIVAFTARNFTVTPSSENVDVKPVMWNTIGDHYKKWTTKNSSSSLISVVYAVGDLAADTNYNVWVNGSLFGSFTSDASGSISFTYAGVFSTTKTFEVKLP